MDHPLNQASLDGLDEMDKILKGMAELDGDTPPHADASLEALRRGEKSLKDEWPAGMAPPINGKIQTGTAPTSTEWRQPDARGECKCSRSLSLRLLSKPQRSGCNRR